jgi:hypothetical protein
MTDTKHEGQHIKELRARIAELEGLSGVFLEMFAELNKSLKSSDRILRTRERQLERTFHREDALRDIVLSWMEAHPSDDLFEKSRLIFAGEADYLCEVILAFDEQSLPSNTDELSPFI